MFPILLITEALRSGTTFLLSFLAEYPEQIVRGTGETHLKRRSEQFQEYEQLLGRIGQKVPF